MSTLGTAIRIASEVHENQRDKGGKPYILHPLRVMFNAVSLFEEYDEDLLSILAMHDVTEDSDITLTDLKNMGFSDRVCDALSLLHHDKSQSYDQYVRAICTNFDAIRVKLCDLTDNSDLMRLKGVSDKDFDRMKKYHKSFIILRKAYEDMKGNIE